MAEFKLGRIKFVWKNEWQTSTTYYKDDVVTNGGKMYICVIGHTSAASFYTDLDIIPTKWNLVSDGFNWKGDWSVDTDYILNDIVKYGARLYIANTVHTSAATTALGLEADQSKWDIFGEGLDWKGDWTVNTRYKINDLVKYGGYTYVVNTAHTSAATAALGLEADQNKWDIFNPGLEYIGIWAGVGYRYRVNDIVRYGASLWICTTAHTATGSFETDEANWEQFIQGLQFEDEWSPFAIYQPGDIVRYGGNQYVAKTNHVGSLPNDVPADWDLFSESLRFAGEWGDDSTSQDYRTGEVVRHGGYTYLCIQDHNNQEPPNATYWERLNSGLRWRGAWSDDAEYLLGDVVRFGDNGYICVQQHISEGDDYSTETKIEPGGGAENSRPDLDLTGTYWNVIVIGSETQVLTTKGDLVYYGGAGPARLPIGEEGQVLKVSSDLIPEWAYLGVTEDVYYVAGHGVDRPAPAYGRSIDKPWRSIRYACEQVEKGTKNPNAVQLLNLNRQFIAREITEWVDYQITNATPGSIWDGFTYAESSCERDMGLIVDALVWDIGHGGNVKSREAALAYVNDTVGSPYLTQKQQTVAAINYGLTVIQNVLNNTAPSSIYQVLNGDNSTAIVSQINAADSEPGVFASITGLVEIITDAITAGNANNIPARLIRTNLIKVATGTYYEVLPIIVPAETCVMGDELRATNVQPRKASNASLTPRADTRYSFKALERMEEIIDDIVSGATVTATSGNTETQFQSYPFGEAREINAAVKLTKVIKRNIDFALGDKLENTWPRAYDLATPARGHARDNILLNKEFIKAEVTAYVDETFPTIKYSRTKCKQDVGYIIDAISYDLTYGGNWQSINAGLAYFNGNTGTLQIDSTEKTATLQAYLYLRDLMTTISRNITVTSPFQIAINQVTGPNASTLGVATVIDGYIANIRTIISNGPSAVDGDSPTVTRIYPDTSNVSSLLVKASNALNDYKTQIGDDTIDFISKNFGSFKYDSAKCRRDLRTIMTDIAYGAVFNSNFNSVQNGLAYTRANSAYVLSNQLTETIGALTYAKGEVNESVTTDGSSATGSSTFATRTDAAFDEIIDILENGTSAADAITYPDHAGVVQNRKDAKDNLVANRQFLINNLIGWINNEIADGVGSSGDPIWDGFTYDQTKCARDTGYFIDALAYDIMYTGTLATTRVAESYFVDGVSQIVGQEANSVAAFTYLATVIEDVVQEIAVTPTYTGTSQTTPGTPATSAEATELTAKINIVNNAITAGNLNSLPAIVFPNISSESAELQDALSNLNSDKEDIVRSVIQYINTTYNDFVYNQAKCSRDIGLIIDAARFDFMLDSNFASMVAAYSYLREPSSKVVDDQKTATLAANEFARSQLVTLVSGTAAAVSGINKTWDFVDTLLFGASAEGNNKQVTAPNVYGAILQLEMNKEFIAEEIHAHIADYYQDIVTDTREDNLNNQLVITNTDWLHLNMPIKFTILNDSTSSVTEAGLDTAITYYVKDIVSDTNFTISLSAGGAELNLTKSSAQFGVEKAYTYTLATCTRDVEAYIDAIKWDMTYPQQYVRIYTDSIEQSYPAAYKSILAARYYANSVLGSQEEDMYYLRNNTGLRLQTLDGLQGDLGPANEFGTSRPTAGAYASLDPGWGPNDQRVWITARSPYIQNLTTFGYAATGQRIDGALHNGGNDSIVSNDFTQVISDGIGAHILNNGRAELVSVFTYYAHIGYLAESGGRIRATNGNNSYGDFGSVAEGVDPEETPVTGRVDNITQYNASIAEVTTDQDKILAFEFDHAGNNYTEVFYDVFGPGDNEETIGDEFRDDGVFQVRLLDLDDSSGQLGGEGFLVVANTAQSGTTTSITLAATDGNISSAYPGMKVIVTGGSGVGQYAIVNTYNSGSKIASVVRESDGVAGWDHFIEGTPIVAPNSSSTYIIEPAVSFSAPPTSSTLENIGANVTDIEWCETAAEYTGLTGSTDSIFGSGASFKITRNTSKYLVDIESGGLGYERGDILTILGTSLDGDTPTNDILLNVISVNGSGAITAVELSGFAHSGKFVAPITSTNTVRISANGTSWSTVNMGGTATSATNHRVANGIVNDGSSALRLSYTVVVANVASGNQVWWSTNNTTWNPVTLPGTPSGNPHIAFGRDKFVIIFEGSDSVWESTDGGNSWIENASALSATGFNMIAYGANRFVIAKTGTTTSSYASYLELDTWTDTTLPGTSAWTDIAWGNNRFLIISNDDNKAAYSLDVGATWIDSDMPDVDGSSVNIYSRIKYGQGQFMAVAQNSGVTDLNAFNTVYTSTDGVLWNTIGTVATTNGDGFETVAFGNPNRTGYWLAGTVANNEVAIIRTGVKARGRASVASEQIFQIKILEPGSGYYNGAPTITVTDPNNIFDITTTVRLGKGVLGNPSFVTRGTGFSAASAEVNATLSNGEADFFQTGRFIAVKNLTVRPVPGSNVVFGTLPDQTFKLVNVISFVGDTDGSYTAFLNISPEMTVSDAPVNNDSVTMRIRYSQVRLTGHDFLDIGTGNFVKTNYPGLPTVDPDPNKETVASNGGRVFFTATDQDGNFRVGDLFSIEQATGVATLNAEAFNIAGLQELTLGEVTLGGNSASVTEFSTDPFFTANSDSVVPTQRAVKAYIEAQIGGGGASLNVNSVTAGDIFIAGNTITTVSDTKINIRAKTEFRGGVTGLPIAYNYFLR